METLTPKRNNGPKVETEKEQPVDVEAAEQNYQKVLNEVPQWKQETYRHPADRLDAVEAVSNEYKAGFIPQRLSGEKRLTVEPFSNGELEHLYTLSKSPSLEEQQQYNDAIRHEPVQRITQLAEYLAARDLSPEPGTDREEVGFSGNLTLPKEKVQPELTEGQMDRLYELSMSHSRNEIEQFGQWLKTLSPRERVKFNSYKTARIEDGMVEKAVSNKVEDAAKPLRQQEGQPLYSYFNEIYLASKGDATQHARALDAVKLLSAEDRFKYDLYAEAQEPNTAEEKLVDIAAMARSVNPNEQREYLEKLQTLDPAEFDRLNKMRFKADTSSPAYITEKAPKRSWWRRLTGSKK